MTDDLLIYQEKKASVYSHYRHSAAVLCCECSTCQYDPKVMSSTSFDQQNLSATKPKDFSFTNDIYESETSKYLRFQRHMNVFIKFHCNPSNYTTTQHSHKTINVKLVVARVEKL